VARKVKKAKRSSVPVAAVDVGSNSIKMTVARRRRGALEVLAEESETVRLGAGLETSKALAPDRIDSALATLLCFAEIARQHGATHLVGVATEATRAATNGEAFLAQAREETGWSLRVISGDEEAALTFRGLGATRDTSGTILVADIGGGSTELIAAESGAVVLNRSIPLGSGRLTDRLVPHDPPDRADIEACRDAAAGQLGAIPFPAAAPDELILLGGTAEALAKFVPDPDRITLADLEGALCRLMAEPAAQVAIATGIPEARARVLPAGVAIMQAMVELRQPANVSLAASGIRTGLILAALDQAATASADPCETLRVLIADLWDEVEETLPMAIAGEDPEGVHQMRVASRRLRAAMDIAAPCFPNKWYRPLHKTAKQVTRSAGAVRDRDVLLQFLKSERKKKLTPEMRSAIDYWAAELSVEREAAREEMLAFLTDFQERDIPAEARRRFAAQGKAGGKSAKKSSCKDRDKAEPSLIDPKQSWAANARRVLKPQIGGLFAFGDAIADPEAVEAHHQARITAKRLRYTLELFADAYGEPGELALDTLKEIQESLGQIHDTDVRIALLATEITQLAEQEDPDPAVRTGLDQLEERYRRARLRDHGALVRTWQRDSAEFEEELHVLIGAEADDAATS